jgi:hypothetical protein
MISNTLLTVGAESTRTLEVSGAIRANESHVAHS